MFTSFLDALLHPEAPRRYLDILPEHTTGRAMVLFDEDNAYRP